MLPTNRSAMAFARRLNRCLEHLNPGSREHGVEGCDHRARAGLANGPGRAFTIDQLAPESATAKTCMRLVVAVSR